MNARTIGGGPRPPARDACIDELHRLLPGVDRADVASVVDRLVQAAATEAGHRVSEAFLEPLQTAVTKHSDGVAGLLERARRELGGERGA